MSAPACQSLVDDGVIRGVLATVGCQTRHYAETGYLALTSGSSVFQTALTGLLVIYVALVGYRLLFAQGGVRLSEAPGMALLVGGVLALTTSWPAFQTLVFDVADRAPVEIAAIVSGPMQDKGLAARPVDGLQAAYDELTATANAYGKAAGGAAKAYSSPQAAAAEATSAAGVALFATSAGVISAATLAIGVLTAVGPLFIALALIPAARGLSIGWARALAAAALTPLVAWLLVVLMLSVLDPWLSALADQRVAMQLDPQTAMSAAALVFVFAFGQAALVLAAVIMALGLRLPRLAPVAGAAREPARRASPPVSGPAAPLPSRAERLALELQRDQVHAAARSRAAAAAAASRPRALAAPAAPIPRLGEAYRRPGFNDRRREAAP